MRALLAVLLTLATLAVAVEAVVIWSLIKPEPVVMHCPTKLKSRGTWLI